MNQMPHTLGQWIALILFTLIIHWHGSTQDNSPLGLLFNGLEAMICWVYNKIKGDKNA